MTMDTPPDGILPMSFWRDLSEEDRSDFIKLRNRLHQSQKASVKDRRLISFSNEMTSVLSFLERTEVGRENRSILAGIAFAGPFICVNTRQLKNFLGRCKSSINGSFQQIGYVAVRTKSKARACVLSICPRLETEANLLRQWTVRGASEMARFCFVSRLAPRTLPVISASDLVEDRKVMPAAMAQTEIRPVRRDYEFDIAPMPELKPAEMSGSYSVDMLAGMNDQWQTGDNGWNPMFEGRPTVHRSQSAWFGPETDWPASNDSFLFED